MRTRPTLVRTAVALVATAASLIAAAADKDDFERRADGLRAGPASTPLLNETGFSKRLKCMDGLVRTFGITIVTGARLSVERKRSVHLARLSRPGDDESKEVWKGNGRTRAHYENPGFDVDDVAKQDPSLIEFRPTFNPRLCPPAGRANAPRHSSSGCALAKTA